jgi:signal transduction histidine kinase
MNEDNVWVYAVGIPTAVPKGAIVAEESRDEVLASYYRIRSAAISFNFLAAILLFLFVFNNRKLSKLFSMLSQRDDQLSQEAVRREKDLEELEKTTRLLVRRDVDLSEANRRLEELDVVKSDFVSIAAHQLRTPLTGIKWSFLALLEKEMGHLDGEQKKIIEDGLGAINHTIKLINDLLNVAHIEEGKFGFNFKNESIEPVIQKIFERFESLAGEKGIWLSADFSKEKLPLVSIDSEKIDLVLDNLLDNAIKYTSPGGKVRFKTEFKNEKIIIIVEDTGIGIPRSQLGRAFTKFFRGENAVLFQTSGTGLGLYMIKNIIDRHCGTITVNSEENKGTTFIIELPKVCKCKLQEK